MQPCATARAVPIRANGQTAIAYYSEDEDEGRFKAQAIDVLTLEDGRIKDITAFIAPQLFAHFGLPEVLA